jgi:hypothetical protein
MMMSNPFTHDDLMSLEEYAKARPEFRAKVMEHKKKRRVALGPDTTLYFEDELTLQYQIQEMLRIEKVFEADGIQDELDAYNPMMPSGKNWKATFMIEYPDAVHRAQMLGKMLGIDKLVWVRIDGFNKVHPITNEDLDRETEDKTSSVHFMRFELSPEMITAAKAGANISMGVDHPAYTHSVDVIDEGVRASLVSDLN